MNIEQFVNGYLQEHRHDVLLCPYNGLIDFANAFKNKMMEDAVEGAVTESYGYEKNEDGEWGQVVSPIIRINVEKYSLGDKVRLIVLPREDSNEDK